MSIQTSFHSQQESNIIVEIETLKSIYPTIEEITEKNETKFVKLQIRLYPRQTQTSFIAKTDDINALTVFEIPRNFPSQPVKVYLEEFTKLPWEKTEILRKKIEEFSMRKMQESTTLSVTVYVLQMATEIEEGLYHAKHSNLNKWNENRFEKNGYNLEFINSMDNAENSRIEVVRPSDPRLLTRTHDIVQVKMRQQGWSRYLARNEQGELRMIDHFIVDFENNQEQQNAKGKKQRQFEPELLLQPLQRLKENQFRVLKNLSHENICSYTDFQFECSTSQLRIEWIRVHNEAIYLSDLVGKSDEYQLLNINLLPFQLHKIVTGIHELHECELYHGNLSLSTLCLDSSGGIILLDHFLPSAIFRELTDAGLVTFDNYPFAKNTQTKFADLNALGNLTAQIFQNKFDLPNDFDENSTLQNCPTKLTRFIRKCLQPRNENYANIGGILKLFFQARNTPTCLYEMHNSASSPRCNTNGLGDYVSGQGQCDGRQRYSSDVYAGLSRLGGDFKDLGEIGKGGYGRVIKALHKIDQRIYAIKIIKLPPNSEHNNLRQAFKREVKMLSQLDHENVVRYYQAWFDVDVSCDDNTDSITDSESESESEESNKSSELFASRDFAQRRRRRRCTPVTALDNSDSSDIVCFRDGGTSNEHSKNSIPVVNSKPLILIRRSSSLASRRLVEVSIEESAAEEKRDRSSSRSEPTESSEDEYTNNSVNNILCLQMEYCESDTIEQLISQDLYKKEEEVLRLFREMMEGLNYIHSKNLIHRDLKPANIFVDSEKHVKIGDFGLAMNVGVESNGVQCVAGTMHYLAPELWKDKYKYTQKVDIYSIGLIFFEMNHPPFSTISEKIRVFSDLKENIFPEEFKYPSIVDQPRNLITRMLSRDPNNRPVAKDIIMNLPPKLADESFQEALRKVLEKPDSTRFRNVLNTIFAQKSLGDSKVNKQTTIDTSQTVYDSFVSKHSIFDRIYELMAKHGAIQIDLPNFYNRSLIQRPLFEAIHLLSDQGSVLSMPFDLRVPFTAFIARNNIEHDMKTFCIGKIYRRNNYDASTGAVSTNTNFSLASQGPEERFEMICDIISPPTFNCLVEAEIMLVTMDILLTFDAFKNDSFCIYLSHSKLLDALLEQYEMNESERRNILQILLKHGPSSSPTTKRRSSAKGFTKLKDLCQAYTHGSGLCHNLVKNYEVPSFEDEFLRENPKLRDNLNFKTALKDIKLLLKHLKGIPSQFSMLISPGVINYLNTEGLLFQVSLTYNSENHSPNSYSCNDDILLATGMMHQNLIAKFRSSKQYPKHAFGVRIDLQECIDREKNIVPRTNFDCVVVPFDSDSNTISDSFSIARDLWKKLKLRCEILKYAEYESKANRFWDKDGIPLIVCVENKRGSKKSRLKLKMFDSKENKFIENEVLQENICDEVTKYFEKHNPQNRIKFQVISNKRSVIGLEEHTIEKLKTVIEKFENLDTIHIIATDLDTKTLLGFMYDLQMKTEIAKLSCLGNDNRQNRIIQELKKYIDGISKNQINSKRLLILYSLSDEKHLIIDCF